MMLFLFITCPCTERNTPHRLIETTRPATKDVEAVVTAELTKPSPMILELDVNKEQLNKGGEGQQDESQVLLPSLPSQLTLPR